MLARGVLVAILGLSSRLPAQQADYRPTTQTPHGRQIVAVYIGATSCGPCQLPDVKAAIKGFKTLAAANAAKEGAAFSVLGVANDWAVSDGVAFLSDVGPFDQIAVGSNWTNIGAERFIWRDSTGSSAMPQIVILERTVTPEGTTITFSNERVLRRIVGAKDIPAWVAAGAPITRIAPQQP
jgi:hypothetical protein